MANSKIGFLDHRDHNTFEESDLIGQAYIFGWNDCLEGRDIREGVGLYNPDEWTEEIKEAYSMGYRDAKG